MCSLCIGPCIENVTKSRNVKNWVWKPNWRFHKILKIIWDHYWRFYPQKRWKKIISLFIYLFIYYLLFSSWNLIPKVPFKKLELNKHWLQPTNLVLGFVVPLVQFFGAQLLWKEVKAHTYLLETCEPYECNFSSPPPKQKVFIMSWTCHGFLKTSCWGKEHPRNHLPNPSYSITKWITQMY